MMTYQYLPLNCVHNFSKIKIRGAFFEKICPDQHGSASKVDELCQRCALSMCKIVICRID